LRTAELGAFLRSRRERLAPATVGFPTSTSSRRTPGLRREELAVLAGIGVSWLIRLEQGGANRVSAEVLNGLASALQLSPVERAHLFSLAGVHLREAVDGTAVSEVHLRLVEGLNPNPAYLLDHHWNLVTWNQAEEDLFPLLADPDTGPRPNLLRLFLEQEVLRSSIDDWPLEIERLTQQFRSHLAMFPSPILDDLVSRLLKAHPEFDQAWSRHDVAPLAPHLRVINHPVGPGGVEQQRFEQHRLGLPDQPGWQLVLFLRR